jgi:phosphatidylglycerol:prolipoprotein diacylglycerol transferase
MPAQTPASDENGEPQALITSFWFDSGHSGRPYSATVRFSGRRLGVTGLRGRTDEFVHDEILDSIVPNSGPNSITARIDGISRGEWKVGGELITPFDTADKGRPAGASARWRRRTLAPAIWSWRRWRLSTVPGTPLRTRFAPLAGFARRPAVIPGSYTVLVTLGVIVGLLVQHRLVAHDHVGPGRVLTASLLALGAGLVGAKLLYVALHPRSWQEFGTDGWCIQGFLVGAALVLTAAATLMRLPFGTVLDATAPGLFLGLAVGRVGCFLTGCCAGRPTASRCGVWSSDRRVGARRIPTQLLESLGSASIGLTGWLVVLHAHLAVRGGLFVASFAAYTLWRQFLLRLRAEPRKTVVGGPVTAAVAAGVLLAAVVLLFVRAR